MNPTGGSRTGAEKLWMRSKRCLPSWGSLRRFGVCAEPVPGNSGSKWWSANHRWKMTRLRHSKTSAIWQGCAMIGERISAVMALPLRHMLDIVTSWDQNNIMKGIDTMPHEGFTVQDRALGRSAAWTAFIVYEAYAVASGLGFLSLKSPSDPIGEPYLSIMALLIVLMAPFLIVTMVAVRAYAPPELKSLAYAALAFMILLAGITSSVNFALLIVKSTRPTQPQRHGVCCSFLTDGQQWLMHWISSPGIGSLRSPCFLRPLYFDKEDWRRQCAFL